MLKALWRAFVYGPIDNDEKVASFKSIPSSKLECKTEAYDLSDMLLYKSPTLFMAKTAEKPYPLGPHTPI